MARKVQWRRYDWDLLFRGRSRRFTLVRGKDYGCSQAAITQQARNYASSNKYKVSVVDGGDRVTVVIVELPPRRAGDATEVVEGKGEKARGRAPRSDPGGVPGAGRG